MKRLALFLCFLALVVLATTPAWAQEEEYQPDPPYEGPCIGSNDPYCGGGGSSGGGGSLGCNRCRYFLYPLDEYGQWECYPVTVQPGDPPAWSQCTPHASGCTLTQLCYVT